MFRPTGETSFDSFSPVMLDFNLRNTPSSIPSSFLPGPFCIQTARAPFSSSLLLTALKWTWEGAPASCSSVPTQQTDRHSSAMRPHLAGGHFCFPFSSSSSFKAPFHFSPHLAPFSSPPRLILTILVVLMRYRG